jgi:hypothetical protein
MRLYTRWRLDNSEHFTSLVGGDRRFKRAVGLVGLTRVCCSTIFDLSTKNILRVFFPIRRRRAGGENIRMNRISNWPGNRSLFAARDASEIVALISEKNNSIATQSAWERVTLSVPIENAPKVYRPDRNQWNWFAGFFEGLRQSNGIGTQAIHSNPHSTIRR